MACANTGSDVESAVKHAFLCTQSNRVLSLTQAELERIPYLNALVSNKHNFTCQLTADDVFILDRQIQYVYLNHIRSVIVKEKSSLLFTELPRHVDVFAMLDVYDYLCIDSLPVPSLEPLRKRSPYYPRRYLLGYHVASPSEARDTAVEFLVAIVKGKYDLYDLGTLKAIFNLLIDILSFPSVFGQRLRYQTLVIAENFCSSIFTAHQRQLLRAYKRSLEMLEDSDPDPNISCQSLQAPDTHIFHWRENARTYTLDNISLENGQKHNTFADIDLKLHFFDDEFYFRDETLLSDSLYFWRLLNQPLLNSVHIIKRLYGFLKNRVAEIPSSDHSERLQILEKCFDDDSTRFGVLNAEIFKCLLDCCTEPSKRQTKQERRFIRFGRSYHRVSPPTVDKFKNKPNAKPAKHF